MIDIFVGDCLDTLRALPSESVQCCITSPPYFGLRDYGVPPSRWDATTYRTIGGAVDVPAMECCLGHEPTPAAFVGHLVMVFAEVRRVLKRDATLWLNIGDSYAANRAYQVASTKGGPKHSTSQAAGGRGSTVPPGMKPKDLMGIPWMLAFALRADGWYLRQDIIWAKPNPMPESATDRCTKAHEYLFLLTKSSRYFFDAEAIAEPLAAASIARLAQDVESQRGSDRVPGKTNGTMKAVGGSRRNSFARVTKQTAGEHGQKPQHRPDREPVDTTERGMRNKRSVWTVATQPFREAHFATFPPALIEPCILAGSRRDDVVLDPFGGAGTTGLVCSGHMRNAILCEMSPKYVEIERSRIQEAAPIFETVRVHDSNHAHQITRCDEAAASGETA